MQLAGILTQIETPNKSGRYLYDQIKENFKCFEEGISHEITNTLI